MDVTAGRGRFEQGDITNVGPHLTVELGRADLVLLAVPEHAALAAIKPVARALRAGALLVDTVSVKGHVVDLVRHDAGHLEMVSINPMFAPSLGIEGRPVAAVVVRGGPRAEALLRLIETWGGRVVRMTEDEHDRRTAAAQALTHATVLAFGLALAELDVDIADLAAIAPPPHALLLALLARIASGAPAVYWDVQSANPRASHARAALARAVQALTTVVGDGDEAGFAAALERLRDLLGANLDRYRVDCARAFEAMPLQQSRSTT
jgi:prephenate dehydrogenase